MKKLVFCLMAFALLTTYSCDLDEKAEDSPYETNSGDKDEESDRDS